MTNLPVPSVTARITKPSGGHSLIPTTKSCNYAAKWVFELAAQPSEQRSWKHYLKGSLTQDFRLQVFFMNRFLRVPEYPIGAI